jgi:hypothetical protein
VTAHSWSQGGRLRARRCAQEHLSIERTLAGIFAYKSWEAIVSRDIGPGSTLLPQTSTGIGGFG